MPLHSALAKLPARLLSWLRFLPRSWISVYILCGSVVHETHPLSTLWGGGGGMPWLQIKLSEVGIVQASKHLPQKPICSIITQFSTTHYWLWCEAVLQCTINSIRYIFAVLQCTINSIQVTNVYDCNGKNIFLRWKMTFSTCSIPW